MTKKLFIISTLLICSQQIFAQKASDVLENGEPVKKGHRMFLKYDITDKVLKVDAVKKDQEVDFTTLEDSIIFLVRKNAINIYLRPLNPLNYSHNTETKVVIDPINQAAETALGDVIGTLVTVINPTKTAPAVVAPSGRPANANAFTKVECKEFTELKTAIANIQKKLSFSKKDDITKIFEALKAITFADEKSTIEALNSSKENIKVIEEHFKEVEAKKPRK